MIAIGIDTHLKMHEIEAQDDDRRVLWRGKIENNRKGFETLREKIEVLTKSQKQDITGIYMNPTGNYHVPLKYFLSCPGYNIILVNPIISKSIRNVSGFGKGKTDAVDAHSLASTPWFKADIGNGHERSGISELTRMRERLSNEMKRLINYLRSDLACVFPEYLLFLNNIDSSTSLKLLETFPVPSLIVNAGKERILDLVRRESRGHFSDEFVSDLMRISAESVGIPDEDGIFSLKIRMAIDRIRGIKRDINKIEMDIKKRVADNEDVKRLDDIPGIDTIQAASIMAEIGNIDQFESAERLQSYGGTTPSDYGSADSYISKHSKVSNRYLATAVSRSAVTLVLHNTREFREIYDRETGKQKRSTQAYITVAKRLLYHIYSMAKNKKPYRERLPGTHGGERADSSGAVS